MLSQKIDFKYGEHGEQTLWLEVVQTMLLESFSVPLNDGESHSKNIRRLREVLLNMDFLNRPVCGYGEKNPPPSSALFRGVQLVSKGDLTCIRRSRSENTVWS